MILDFDAARREMVEEQLRSRGVADPRVLDVMARVPRERFAPETLREMAYDDRPLPIGDGQTISQPLIVAMMLVALELDGHERVLDVGTGSGYQAALLSGLAREVISVEIVPRLADHAERLLSELGCANVTVVRGDGSLGWADGAPYDGIVAAAASPRVPQALLDQLADGGRLVIPVGGYAGQDLVQVVKRGAGIERRNLGACAFVPLLGAQGWPAGGDRPEWEH